MESIDCVGALFGTNDLSQIAYQRRLLMSYVLYLLFNWSFRFHTSVVAHELLENSLKSEYAGEPDIVYLQCKSKISDSGNSDYPRSTGKENRDQPTTEPTRARIFLYPNRRLILVPEFYANIGKASE